MRGQRHTGGSTKGITDKARAYMAGRWYVLRSKPNKEDALSRQVATRGIEVYYPRVTVQPVNPRARTTKPFFPGYMFVRADLVQVGLSTFQWMPYALGLVCFDTEPATIVDSTLQALRRDIEQMARDEAKEDLQLPPGTPLTINGGPFAGYKAIFDTRLPGSDRIRILLNVARGAQVPVELAAAYVEKAA